MSGHQASDEFISSKLLFMKKQLITIAVIYLIVLLLPAHSFAAGSITGRVTNISGTGIAGVSVWTLDPVTGSYINIDATTQSDGTYTIAGLPAGSYKLQFYVGSSTGYIGQYYNNKTSSTLADAVPVTVGVATSGINATLAIGGGITGRVTNISGTGIAGVLIYASAADGGYRFGTTQSDGSYIVMGLAAGSYKLQFSSSGTGYISQYYNNKTSSALADAVLVTVGATTSEINATLAMGGAISGRVTNVSGIGISGVSVWALDTARGSFSSSTTTQLDGSYTILGLAAGNYKVEFYGSSTGYISQYYNNKTSSALADAVSVTDGATTSGINSTLTMGGAISGRVTNSYGIGISGVSINASAADGSYGFGTTQPDGSYTIMGLAAGSYMLQFSSIGTGYITQYYNNKTTPDLANAVSVTGGATTNEINATLAPGGAISGRVTNSSGAGIADVMVITSDPTGIQSFGSGYAFTQSDGSYTITGLAAGNYKLQFNGSSSGYITQWYNNKTSSELVDVVPVAVGVTASGINATLAPGGSISGRVTNVSGIGISSVFVTVTDTASGSGFGGAITQSDGTYMISGLPSSSYHLEFNGFSTGYITQWYSDKASSALADTVTVTVGATTTGVNAMLTIGGSISGRVINESGLGLQTVQVQVSNLSGDLVASAMTDGQGNYKAVGLPSGMFKVHFSSVNAMPFSSQQYSGLFSGQWYSNKGEFGSADSVSITYLEEVPNINAVLSVGPDIIATPVVVSFGTYLINTTTTRPITISNDGSSELTLGTIGLSGANSTEFSLQDDLCSGKTLPLSSSCTFKTKFNPTSIGVKGANIIIPSNDPDTAVLKIALSGVGSSNDPILNTIILGTGTGSVHSSPMTGISCIKDASTGCSAPFTLASVVTLIATPDSSTSSFNGWSNACSAEPCDINMNTSKTAIATFSLAPKSKLDLLAITGFDTLPLAYNDALSTIFALEGLFSGEWLLDKGKDIILSGGYLADYRPVRNGFSILNGKLTIKSGSLQSGSLRVDRLVVRDTTVTPPP